MFDVKIKTKKIKIKIKNQTKKKYCICIDRSLEKTSNPVFFTMSSCTFCLRSVARLCKRCSTLKTIAKNVVFHPREYAVFPVILNRKKETTTTTNTKQNLVKRQKLDFVFRADVTKQR
eukprot:m.58048 g.58048  ORF g.58048 m.58048 type:complete len:118 (+) comp22488_c0_seq2:2656-3009(+)